MQTRVLSISGMTCGHCVQAVTKSLAAVPGVTSVRVNLDPQEASVEGDADPAALIQAVMESGYGATVRAG